MNSLWQKYKFEENGIYTTQVGNCRFWIRKLDKIWQIAKTNLSVTETIAGQLTKVDALDEGVDWSHHIANKHSQLHLLPSTPERPLIVKPTKNISILAGMNLDIYLEVPLWIQLYVSSVKDENLLLEFPVNEPSSTWFGEPDNGELAYSYPGDIYFHSGDISLHSGMAICPLKIRNESESALAFQRLSVPVEQLNLYANQEMICTNEVNVRYKGEDKTSEIQISGGNPTITEGLKIINNARIRTSRNILKKSFSFIKSITDY